MAMLSGSRTGRLRARTVTKGRWSSVVLVGVLLFFSVFTAFPAPWNSAVAKVGLTALSFPSKDFTLGLDLKGGVHLLYEADMSNIADAERVSALEGVRDVIERRANALGVAESRVETTIESGHYRVIVELPGIQDASAAMALIGETPVLEFKTPTAKIETEPTVEQKQQINADQETQRAAALAVLDRALAGEDFAALATEFSIDASTKDTGGALGFLSADNEIYGELVSNFGRRQKTGVVDGLYESGSTMHIMRYLGVQTESELSASHILICFAGATSCTESRTKDEARALVDSIKAQATADNFAELARTNSSDPGSKDAGGDLGLVRKGMMVQGFEDALFVLADGAISDVVETEYGYHLIYRASSTQYQAYDLAHIEMPWTTASDVVQSDPWENTALSGKDVTRAEVAFDPQTVAPYILLSFSSEGGDLFAALTEANVGQVIGIFLDGEAITTPVVQGAIYGGQAQITGSFSVNEAKLLAQRLTAGALPVPISPVSQQTIGPTLGQASLDASVQAALIGFLLISLFMVLYYRLPGALAVVALTVYAFVNLALYKLFGVTITLSGIAGFVLSLGIAVDANVLIFERLKEELRAGRDLPSAIKEAASRAWPSIRDGNATTLIATMILFTMGTSFIKGFALTLTVGILVSIFCSMVITVALLAWAARAKKLRTRSFYLGL
ncbi:MAG: protein translocase subunit SecD [Patescibacteria group bacterium]